MNLNIFGGTGFIGKEIITLFLEENYRVNVFTRNRNRAINKFPQDVNIIEWSSSGASVLKEYFIGDYVIINLAGENIGSGRWTKKRREKIRNSRINITKTIAHAIEISTDKPRIVLQGSATGFYGISNSVEVDENSGKGQGFLANIVLEWELAMKSVEKNTRVVYLRTGVVLGMDGGIYPKLLKAFKLFAGGHFGDGLQWFSWIHMDDLKRIILFVILNEKIVGPVNITSPFPVEYRKFCKLAAGSINRPSWLHVPAFILRLAMGEMADELLLSSQKVQPRVLLDNGFKFTFTSLQEGLNNLAKEIKS